MGRIYRRWKAFNLFEEGNVGEKQRYEELVSEVHRQNLVIVID